MPGNPVGNGTLYCFKNTRVEKEGWQMVGGINSSELYNGTGIIFKAHYGLSVGTNQYLL